MPSHLYLMQTTSGALKIGRSSNPERRRRGLETGGGRKIVVLAVLNEMGHREGELHAALAGCRHLGEWFALTAESRRVAREVFGVDRLPYPVCGGKGGRRSAGEKEASEAIAALALKIASTPRKRRPITRFVRQQD